MSSNKALVIFVTFIWTIIGGYYFLADSHSGHDHAGHDHSENRMTSKLSAGVSVDFQMLNSDPKMNEPIDVVASITSNVGPGEYEYKFFMPRNAELIQPNKEGSFYLNKDQVRELNIQFSQRVEYDMKIHLEIRKPGSPNASMFTFSTLDFQKNQEEIEALQERKSQYNK